MRRREFITLVSGAVTAWPLVAFGKDQRIAIVFPSYPVSKMTERSGDAGFRAFFDELSRLGYVEGQNLLIERYSGDGQASRYPDLVRDVVSRNPDVIVTVTNRLVLEFKATTTKIPIVGVFAVSVEAGIVASLARPGGNITGLTADVGREQWAKRIQLLQQVVPQATRLAVLESRAVREQKWGASQRELERMGITRVGPTFDHPADEDGYRRVFATLTRDRADGIMVNDEEENLANLKLIVELVEKSRLPAIYPYKMFVEAGGLMSYGANLIDYVVRNHAVMVGLVLKGAKPADIPIRQPTKFELVINLKTANALGLTVPATLLATADEVIE